MLRTRRSHPIPRHRSLTPPHQIRKSVKSVVKTTIKEIHWNAAKEQWELNGRKTTFDNVIKYWEHVRGRKARWSTAAFQEMQRIILR